ncbi:hypothetical protein LCGC14_2658260 [marine sediment metagenome]|uniref:Uncharacterized protein n=1 Tax=marine sediment metagenome TaxID=412755 RepID=A0A0F9C367_9ZZZZ
MGIRLEPVENIAFLKVGEIVQNRGSGQSYIILKADGEEVIAVRSVSVSNAAEWALVVEDKQNFDDVI